MWVSDVNMYSLRRFARMPLRALATVRVTRIKVKGKQGSKLKRRLQHLSARASRHEWRAAPPACGKRASGGRCWRHAKARVRVL